METCASAPSDPVTPLRERWSRSMGSRSPLAAGPRGVAVLVLLLGRVAFCSVVEEKKGRGAVGVPPPLCWLSPVGPWEPGRGRRRAAASCGERRRESPNYLFP